MKYIQYPITLAIVIALLAGCSKKPEDPYIRIGIENYPSKLDPRRGTDAYSYRVNQLLYCGLVRLNEKMELTPWAAKKIEKPSPTTYIIELRSDLKYHNGKPVLARDVVATFESIRQGTVNSPFHQDFQIIKKIETVSERVIKLELTQAFLPFESLFQIGILPEKIAQKKEMAKEDRIGCGPYQIEVDNDGENLRLKKSKYYFLPSEVRNPGLYFKIIKDDTVRGLELMKGSVDIVQNAISPETLKSIQKKGRLHVVSTPSNNVNYLAMKFDNPYLSDKKVRRAIDLALDRKLIIKAKLNNEGIAANSLFSPLTWVYNKNLRQNRYDPVLAEKLLDEAGFKRKKPDNMRFELEWRTSSSSKSIQLAQIMANQLKKIGIRVKVISFEWATFYQDIINGNFQLHSLRWVGLTEPDMYYHIFHSDNIPPKGSKLNRAQYINSQMNDWTYNARYAPTKEKRKNLYDKIQAFVQDESLVIYLWHENHTAVYNDRVAGVKIDPLGSFMPFINFTKGS